MDSWYEQNGCHYALYFYRFRGPIPSISTLSGLWDMSFQNKIVVSVTFFWVPSNCFISNVFVGGSKVYWVTWRPFPRDLIWKNRPDLPEIIRSFRRFPMSIRPLFSGSILGGSLLVPWIPSESSYEVFRGNDLQWRAMYWEFLSMPSGLVVPWQRSYHGAIFPFLWQDLFLLTSFLLLCRWGEVKIEEKEKSRFYLLFWFWLLTHHVMYWLYKGPYAPRHGDMG